MRIVTAALLLVSTLPAFAESPAAEPVDTETPWSLGAGLGFGGGDAVALPTPIVVVSGGGVAGLSSLGGLSAQVMPRVSFERRLSPRLSLGGSLSANASSLRSSPYTSASWSGGVSVGPRWTLTGPSAPVAVLVFVDALGTLSSTTYSQADATPLDLQAFALGLGGGLGVERALLPYLSLRIQAQLAHVSWARTFLSAVGEQAAQFSTSFRASVAPSAFAELRLAF